MPEGGVAATPTIAAGSIADELAALRAEVAALRESLTTAPREAG